MLSFHLPTKKDLYNVRTITTLKSAMNAMRFFCILTLLLFGCTLTQDARNASDDIPLSQFIIGTWRQAKSGSDQYQLEFVNPETLIYNEKSGKSSAYNLVFHYKFVDDNRIRVENRLVAQWDLSRANQDLIIKPSNSLGPEGVFERIPTVNWPAITVFLLVVIVSLGVATNRSRASMNNSELGSNRITELQYHRKKDLFSFYLPKILATTILGLGMLVGNYMWAWWSNFLIRLPWDAIILFEVNMLVLIFSVKIIKMNRTSTNRVSFFVTRSKYFLGIFLTGASIGGMATSLLKLAIFAYFGSYGFGA